GVNLRRPQQIVLHKVFDAAHPRLIGIPAKIDALDKGGAPLGHVGHIDVEVEYEVRNLLNTDPSNEIHVEVAAIHILAPAASPDHLSSFNFLLLARWNGYEGVLT